MVNRSDPDHEPCREVWSKFRGELVTVEGVLVEACYLLRRAPGGVQAVVEMVNAVSACFVGPSMSRFLRTAQLVEKYQDVPMDWVDGSLVAVAEELSVNEILTLDRRGFEVYRIKGKGRFALRP